MANIGSLALKIVADAAPLEEGTAKAAKAVGSFADTAIGRMLGVKGATADMAKAWGAVKGGAASAWSGVKGLFDGTSFGGGAYSAIKDGLGWLADKTGLSGAIKAMADPVGTLNGKFKELSGGINDTWKDAQRLGVSMGDMMGLEAMGLETALLAKFRKNDGTGDMVAGLARFADELKATESQSDRVVMAMEKLGKTGVSALHVLQKGGEAVRARLAEIRGLGYALTDGEAAAVGSAKKAQKDVQLMWEGANLKLAAAMAPSQEAWARMWSNLAPVVSGAATLIGSAIGAATEGIAALVRVMVDDIGTFWGAFSSGGDKGGSTLSTMEQWSQSLRLGLLNVAKAFGYVWDIIRMGIAQTAPFLAQSMMMQAKANRMSGINFFGTPEALEASAKGLLRAAAAWGGIKLGDTAARMQAIFDEKSPFKRDSSKDSARFDYHPTQAMRENSREAASVLARWRSGALADPMLKVAKEQLKALTRIDDGIKRMKPNKVQLKILEG